MSKYVLLVGMFFLCLMLMCPPSVYPQDEEEPPRSDQLPVGATLPSTQSTANMDSMNTLRSNDEFLISPSDLDIDSRLTSEAEMRLYKYVLEKSQREHDARMRSYRDHLEREISRDLDAAEKLKLDKASGKYLPPNRDDRDFLPGYTPGVSVSEKMPEDDWDFLADFIPGVSVYENMPEVPVTPIAPEAIPSPQKGQAPADGKSGGSGRAQDQDKNLGPDLFVQ